MFKSLNHDEEDIYLPNERSIEPKNVKVNGIPLDCIGVIMTFTSSVKVFKNMILLNKEIEQYIKFRNSDCVGHLEFCFISKPPGNVPYAKVLIFEDNFVKSNKVITCFPNLRTLVLRDNPKVKWKFFSHVNAGLQNLEIDGCMKLTKKANLSHFRNLRTLRIDYSHNNYGENELNLSFLESLENLEILCLYSLSPIKFDPTQFKSLKKLRVLKLRTVETITDEVFNHTPNLEIVKLTTCFSINYEGFKQLKKLEEVKIDRCRLIFEKPLLKALEEIDVKHLDVVEWKQVRKKGKVKRRK